MREITYRDLLVNDLQKMRNWEFSIKQLIKNALPEPEEEEKEDK